jgi:hypothetical protein
MDGRRLWWRSSGLELHPIIPDSIPPEALMRFGFIRPGSTAQAIASQLQPVASELVPALREAAGAERGRSRTGERP